MRPCFLLDEQISPDVAALLARDGVDAHAVQADANLRGLDDRSIDAEAVRRDRVLVTYNVRDFVPLLSQRIAAGGGPPGMVFVDEATNGSADLRGLAAALAALARRVERGEVDVSYGYHLGRHG